MLPRNITPGQAARRALLGDLAIAALLTLVAIAFATGIGVVGFFALLILLAALIWIATEATVKALLRRRTRRRGGSKGSAATRHPPPRSRRQAGEHGFTYPGRDDEDDPSGRPDGIGSIRQGTQYGPHQDC
jgi:uncharacterized protein (DUF58 family)